MGIFDHGTDDATDLKLPDLPDGLEWVVHADPDRFTVHLSTCPKRGEQTEEDGEESSDDKPTACGYLMSHTHKHQAVVKREDWEREVINAAEYLWTHYTEGNRHAAWADELMRRSR